jgi:hypothetical protein
MGGEPAEIETLRARASAAGAASAARFAGKRPPAELPALPRPGRRRGLAAPKGRQHAFQGLHVPRLRAAAPGHAHLSHTQILDEANAWLVDATPDALAAGIRAVLGQPDEAARRRRAGGP